MRHITAFACATHNLLATRSPQRGVFLARALRLLILLVLECGSSRPNARPLAWPSFFIRCRRAGGSSPIGVHTRTKLADSIRRRGVAVSECSVIVSCWPPGEPTAASRTSIPTAQPVAIGPTRNQRLIREPKLASGSCGRSLQKSLLKKGPYWTPGWVYISYLARP